MILTRRNFFLSAAIIPAASLMPGHSIAHLLKPTPRKFWSIHVDPLSMFITELRPLVFGVMEQPICPNGFVNKVAALATLTPDEIDAYKSGRMTTILQDRWRELYNVDDHSVKLQLA